MITRNYPPPYLAPAAIMNQLSGLASRYPNLLIIDDSGELSLKHPTTGQAITPLIVTNYRTGLHDSKPGILITLSLFGDALAPSQLVLYLVEWLLRGFGSDNDVTMALNQSTIYILPFLYAAPQNSYGAQRRQQIDPTPPRTGDTITAHDLDGDGRVLWMRLPDPLGGRKPHPTDPDLLIRCDPDDVDTAEGTYYRVFPEGSVQRSFAAPDSGADLAMELRMAADFIASHPNVAAVAIFQGAGGSITAHTADTNPESAALIETLKTMAVKTMGVRSVPLDGRKETSDLLKYLARRAQIPAFTVQMYTPFPGMAQPLDEAQAAEVLARLTPKERARLYVPWYPYQHPQLGAVELGGWDLNALNNPPSDALFVELEKASNWVLRLALALPQIRVAAFELEPMDNSTHIVRLTVENRGWLPTSILAAPEAEAMRPVTVTLDLPSGARLLVGETHVVMGTLNGRAHLKVPSMMMPQPHAAVDTRRAQVEWVISAPMGGEIALRIAHPLISAISVTEFLEPG